MVDPCDYTDARISQVYCYADFEIAEHLEEAFERGAKMAPAAIGDEHLTSALRSIKYMLNSEWTTIGIRQWLVVQSTQTMSTGSNSFRLPDGGLDIHNAVMRRAGVDVPMARMNRQEYTEFPNKTQRSRPDRYSVDRRYNQALVYVLPVPENSTDVMVFDYFRQPAQPGTLLANKLQMPPMFLEAFVAGLSARLAMKYKPEDWAMLQTYYRGPDPSRIGGVLGDAINEDRDRTDTQYRLMFNARGRRR